MEMHFSAVTNREIAAKPLRLCVITFALSLIDPLPSTEILAPVSSCSLLMVFPWGPRIFPTKLNCEVGKKSAGEIKTLNLGLRKKVWSRLDWMKRFPDDSITEDGGVIYMPITVPWV